MDHGSPAQVYVPIEDAQYSSKPCFIPKKNITITWVNLNFSVQIQKGKKEPAITKNILQNVNGIARPGELLVLMGPSGAGKTTLLNCLAGRNKQFTGDILMNGSQWDNSLVRETSFVQQHDLFIPVLTVKEHLEFTAKLRMDQEKSQEERDQLVQNVIDELGLTKSQNTRIGDPGRTRGISGGERKRLAFASEMLTNPSILFADEPTSGLDSFMAKSVVDQLHSFAKAGRTVIATIHQPSSDIFAIFDQLMLLTDGRLGYIGPANQSVPYFNGIGFSCPLYICPGDYFMNQLSIIPGEIKESMERIETIVQSFKESDQGKAFQLEVEKFTGQKSKDSSLTTGTSISIYKTSFGRQFSVLLKRQLLVAIRHPILFRAKIAQAIVVSLVIGILFYQLDNNQRGVQDINGALFFLCVYQTMGNALPILSIFADELPIFMREHKSGSYSISSYYLATTISDLPLQIMIPAIAVTIVYWFIGLNPAVDTFFLSMLTIVLEANVAVSMAYTISAIAPSATIATMLGPAILIPFMLFGGLLINEASIPSGLKWFSEISFIKYGFNALAINEWTSKSHDSIDCENPNMCFYRSGDAVLKYLSIEDDLAYNIGMMGVLVIVFRFLSFLFLLRRAKKPEEQ